MQKISLEEKRIQFNAWIREDIVTKFRRFVAERYGEAKTGIIGSEVEMALMWYMDANTHTQITTNVGNTPPNPPERIQRIKEQIKRVLCERYGYESTSKVQITHLEDAISAVRGSDPRTLKKWKAILRDFHVLKQLNVITFELV
jgi:hypothetical protein